MTDRIQIIAASLGTPILGVHGGAGPSPSIAGFEERQAYLIDLVRRRYRAFRDGGDTAEAARRMVVDANVDMEDDPRFNTGYGGKLQKDGKVRTSAAIMDGARLRLGAVYNVLGCRYPSRLADAQLERRWRSLDGMGGAALMAELGMEPEDLVTEHRVEELKRKTSSGTGTVGAVAVDGSAGPWALTSTGGAGAETPGRISDTPMPPGNYATPQVAISATGLGEQIIDLAVCPRIATRMIDGMPLREAVERTLTECIAVFGDGTQIGLIAATPAGEFLAAYTTAAMTFAAIGPLGECAARRLPLV